MRLALAVIAFALALAAPATAQDGAEVVPPIVRQEAAEAPSLADTAVSVGTPAPGEDAVAEGAAGEHAEQSAHHTPPPVWLVIPFVALLLMIATGPLFYPHHWHHHYPKYAVGLGLVAIAGYFLAGGDGLTPALHAIEEYLAFIALLTALFVASGTILLKTDFIGSARVNTGLLAVGSVLANLIGTTGASMLLIRPYLRLNRGRVKPYHVVFFIFIVSNVAGSLTPIGDPPLFLGFLRGVPFFWTLAHIWYIWLPTILILLGVFYWFDARNLDESVRERAQVLGDTDIVPGEYTDERPVQTTSHIAFAGAGGFVWLALTIVCVFLDPNVMAWVPDLHALFHIPFGIREILMFGIAFGAYRTANREAMEGNEFSFEPIKEVAWLFIGIFLTMQPALELIRVFAAENSSALNATTFYFGTGILSGVLDNAPTYLSFVSAAMGKFGLDVNAAQDVACFAAPHCGDALTWYYLQAISVAAVFWGAMTYIGNGPNFMVKAIAESQGVETPSFGAYALKYAIPILLPIYILVWLVFFSGWVPIHEF